MKVFKNFKLNPVVPLESNEFHFRDLFWVPMVIASQAKIYCSVCSSRLIMADVRCCCANCHVPGQPLIGQWPDIQASDWSLICYTGLWLVRCQSTERSQSEACQTWRLLSVMYRPLRRHTYHSVTNNTNSSGTTLDSDWSEGVQAVFLLVHT